MREAADWVEYCNGTGESALVKLRRSTVFRTAPGKVLGNRQRSGRTLADRLQDTAGICPVCTEYAKVMKWTDPISKLLHPRYHWEAGIVERTQLMLEQAGSLIDYLSLHWYVGNWNNDFAEYMTVSELMEERLSAYEG